MEFNFKDIEKKWKEKWDLDQLYKVDIDASKPKYYVLDMFPYPSGAGLHVGHPLGYIASDIYSRFKRLHGYNVLHPMGFDSFGLPAEEYAIASGVHPAISTKENINRYKEQLSNLGFSYDWSRQVITCEPKYYKWTQWIFSLLFQNYYDLDANKAVPIETLISNFSKNGTDDINAYCSEDLKFSAEEWNSWSRVEKSDILSSYRLAYRRIGYVNWCEALGTVLANDQIKDGISERGGHSVERKAMTQWYLRITAYAERLLSGLDDLEWSNALKTMQTNWIGKSNGARMFFEIDEFDQSLEIFTTRPDTIFGATFMVLAPEHPYVDQITKPEYIDKISAYKEYVRTRSERDRMSDVKEVSGEFTGAYAIHPFTRDKIPVWIGEYVLMDYGTGAIMAVPSDDERDYLFASKFNIPINEIIDRGDNENAKRGDKSGVLINSDFITGMSINEAIENVIQRLESEKIGNRTINYKMRDANFSRQRYWGEPFPILFDNEGVPEIVDLDELPVVLPDTDDFKPTKDGQSPVSRVKDWVNHGDKTRETDTMPAVAGSSWYFLRYMDPDNNDSFASNEALTYWDSVDLYIGGAEHAVSHLLYARFWHKFLFDLGYVPSEEPFKKLINQGMIQGVIEYMALVKDGDKNIFICADNLDDYKSFSRIPVHIDFVSQYGQTDSHLNIEGIKQFLNWRPEYRNASYIIGKKYFTGEELMGTSNETIKMYTISEVGKMSKRYYNVVNPDDVVAEYGADSFRMYEMFLGPIEQSKPWDTKGIEGVSKFVRKVWSLFYEADNNIVTDEKPTNADYKALHQAIKKVKEDVEAFSFNTAISAMMICVNELRKNSCSKKIILSDFVKLLSPFAPFLCEELWSCLGYKNSVHLTKYPEYNESYLVEDEIEYPICVNGKKRFTMTYPADSNKDYLQSAVLELDELSKWVEGKEILKVIVVPDRMINIVVK